MKPRRLESETIVSRLPTAGAASPTGRSERAVTRAPDGDRPWKGRRRRSCGGCCGSRDASRGRGSGQPDPGRADADGIRVMVAEVLGRPAVLVEPTAVLLEIRGVVLAGGRRGVEAGVAVETHDVAAHPVVVEVERDLRVGPDVVVAARVLLAVHEDLAVLPHEPDGHRLR